jgi:hypothetical protein
MDISRERERVIQGPPHPHDGHHRHRICIQIISNIPYIHIVENTSNHSKPIKGSYNCKATTPSQFHIFTLPKPIPSTNHTCPSKYDVQYRGECQVRPQWWISVETNLASTFHTPTHPQFQDNCQYISLPQYNAPLSNLHGINIDLKA